MWNQWSRALALAGAFLFVASPLPAQPRPGMPLPTALGQRIDMALRNRVDLELTDRQIEHLRALRADFEDRMVELRQEARQARSQVRRDLLEERDELPGDREARRERMLELRQRMQAAGGRLREEQAPFLERYGQILDADQREWLAARTARMGRMMRRSGPAGLQGPGERGGVRGGAWLRPAPERGFRGRRPPSVRADRGWHQRPAPERGFRGRGLRPGMRGGGSTTPPGA